MSDQMQVEFERWWELESGSLAKDVCRMAWQAAWNARALPAEPAPQEPVAITEDQHRAAVKVLTRANGLDGLPQRMLDAMRIAAPAPQEAVAVIGDVFSLHWIGSGPIAPLIERHGLKVGDKLYASPQAQEPHIPAGYKLVPVEPTPEMLEAIPWPTNVTPRLGVEAYRAMLAAAPSPAQGKQ